MLLKIDFYFGKKLIANFFKGEIKSNYISYTWFSTFNSQT